jgi:hypothetical protein
VVYTKVYSDSYIPIIEMITVIEITVTVTVFHAKCLVKPLVLHNGLISITRDKNFSSYNSGFL